MASNIPCRSLRALASPARSSTRIASVSTTRRSLSSTPHRREENQADQAEKPRWMYTPPGTKAPFSLHLHSKRPNYPVNEDQEVLDKFYISLLGSGGDKVLSDKLKWLAVTHKSFDQGRRGFNDRLGMLGKRIVHLQASLSLVQNPGNYKHPIPPLDRSETRQPFEHPALEGLDNLSYNSRGWVTHKRQMVQLAQDYKLLTVLRWQPKNPRDLVVSGVEIVLAHTLYAIVGAIAVERGGVEANKFVQERILAPQGLSSS
ncbi:RNase III domain protein [Talaromyces proteolyticus]|uniref:RNase III domain protein n=1 Tax=Talaromyces proteolyticus TaxID=1131652 RepID=A0AAD4KXS7_9EURO|nr:RNase III domain protein [Talaromyces proteolyticus]KAH8702256.1 RNase III domain protein [Talaromyces proteolyticus]